MENNRKNLKNSAGFTFVEASIGIFVFVVLSLGLTALISGMFTGSNKQSNLLADADQARRVAFGIVNQLRDAQSSATGAYPLETALDQALTFYGDADGDAAIEKIRYYVLNGQLYRGVTKPGGNPLAYNPATEETVAVQNNLANASAPLFYYYDDSYDGNGTPLAQPVNVTQVKFIKLDLKIYNKAGLQGVNTYSVAAGGAFRNLKDNLGEGTNLLIQYNLTTLVTPPGAGTVAVSPTGPTYNGNTLVNLNAYPNLGFGFDHWAGGVSQPNQQATTLVMDSDKTITANMDTLPKTLTGSISAKSGPTSARRWTLRITNSNNFAVNNTNLYAFTLTQTAGPACSPVVILPVAWPALVGNIGAFGSRTYQVTINFTGCNNSTRFSAFFSFAGNNGAQWGDATIANQAE